MYFDLQNSWSNSQKEVLKNISERTLIFGKLAKQCVKILIRKVLLDWKDIGKSAEVKLVIYVALKEIANPKLKFAKISVIMREVVKEKVKLFKVLTQTRFIWQTNSQNQQITVDRLTENKESHSSVKTHRTLRGKL